MRARDLAEPSPTVTPDDRALVGQPYGPILWWALALGADLGGNASAVGASANSVVLGIAERDRQPISFWTFTRYGLPVTAATVAVSALYPWLRHFALA